MGVGVPGRVSRSVRRVALSGVLVLALATPGAGRAQEEPPRHAAVHAGLGVASVAATIVYGTVKTVYALAGTLTGSVAFLLTGGDSDVARKIIQPAVRGDYVVTPAHLTSDRPLVFSGRDPYRYY